MDMLDQTVCWFLLLKNIVASFPWWFGGLLIRKPSRGLSMCFLL